MSTLPANPSTMRVLVPAQCKLCDKTFALPMQLYELGTNTPTADLMKFSHDVNLHVSKKHPERIEYNLAIYQMYDSYSMLACVKLAGPLLASFDKMRHQLHKHTRLVRVSDQKMIERVTALNLINPHDTAKVLGLLTEFRDVYEERGLHPEIDRAEAEAAAAANKASVIITP